MQNNILEEILESNRQTLIKLVEAEHEKNLAIINKELTIAKTIADYFRDKDLAEKAAEQIYLGLFGKY